MDLLYREGILRRRRSPTARLASPERVGTSASLRQADRAAGAWLEGGAERPQRRSLAGAPAGKREAREAAVHLAEPDISSRPGRPRPRAALRSGAAASTRSLTGCSSRRSLVAVDRHELEVASAGGTAAARSRSAGRHRARSPVRWSSPDGANVEVPRSSPSPRMRRAGGASAGALEIDQKSPSSRRSPLPTVPGGSIEANSIPMRRKASAIGPLRPPGSAPRPGDDPPARCDAVSSTNVESG
jgi:hypothetical protein